MDQQSNAFANAFQQPYTSFVEQRHNHNHSHSHSHSQPPATAGNAFASSSGNGATSATTIRNTIRHQYNRHVSSAASSSFRRRQKFALRSKKSDVDVKDTTNIELMNKNDTNSTSTSTSNKIQTEEESSLEYIQDKISMFQELAIPYFKESKNGRWLFGGMLALTILNSGVSVAFSYVGKDFWNALNSKDEAEFYNMMFKYAAALLVGSPVSVFYSFQREKLAVAWREWMTDRVLQLYSSNRVYYSLERGSEIDNPDQRITGAYTTVRSLNATVTVGLCQHSAFYILQYIIGIISLDSLYITLHFYFPFHRGCSIIHCL